MDIQALWIVVLFVATPVAGVVGFAIQLRQVQKAHLENEKLRLEITALKESAAISERRIMEATNQEVMRISHPDMPMFSRSSSRSVAQTERAKTKTSLKEIKESLINGAILFGLALVACYLVYDIYRLIVWIAKF